MFILRNIFLKVNTVYYSRSIHLEKSPIYKNINTQSHLDKHRSEIIQRGLPKVKPIENVKHIILIASGKGGVGKSTIAVNLATAIKAVIPDKSVGLLDADIFGPSLPLMMNLNDTPRVDKNKQMIPLINYGIKCMSMGFLIEEDSPVIWRGLMVMQALEKLMRGVNWGSLDYLIIDTPPGTGDTHLSLIQNLPIDGVVLITTPQSAALQVTKRGAVMFKKLKIPIFGIVENMSYMECPKCSNHLQLFGNGTKQLAKDINVPILQKIPLQSNESVIPVVIQNQNNTLSIIYKTLASNVLQCLNENKTCHK